MLYYMVKGDLQNKKNVLDYLVGPGIITKVLGSEEGVRRARIRDIAP